LKINADAQAFESTLVMSLNGQRIDEVYADCVRRVREHEKQLLSKSLSDASILAVAEALAAGENDSYGVGDQSLITHLRGMAGSNAQQPFRVAWCPTLGCNEYMVNPVPEDRFHQESYFGNAKKVRAAIARTRARLVV
jgi:hypothetical protein